MGTEVRAIAFDKAAYDRQYNDQKTTVVRFRLNKVYDADLLKHLAEQPNMSGYIKELIRADMEKKKTR